MADSTELRAVAEELREWTTVGARRILLVADAIDEPQGHEAWAGIDARDAVDLPRILARMHETHLRPRLLSWIELLRNVAVLLPIAVTWAGLWEAMKAYRLALAADPTLAELPFLYLWEDGFRGHLASPMTLSTIAFIDVAIILVIVGLTVVVHYATGVWTANSAHRLAVVEGRLQACLLDATLEFRQRGSMSVAVDRFARGAKLLLAEMKAEREHLEEIANQREVRMAEIDSFAKAFKSAATNLASISQALSQSVADSAAASENVGRAVGDLVAQQGRLDLSLQVAARETTAGSKALVKVASAVELTATALTDVSDPLARGSVRMSDSADILRREVGELRQQLTTDAGASAAAVAGIAESAKQATAAALVFRSTVDSLVAAVGAIEPLVSRLGTALTQVESFAAEQRATARALADVAVEVRDLSRSASTVIETLERR